jgi:2-polyprenyl-6-methoxyphenol hydroxylase-like FAD-dependent oxidoreductase
MVAAMTTYDAIVVGARCAGSPTAMLLARRGHRVLMVDRATFPSDTVSTHLLHAPGVAALGRWGVLDRLAATGCPPIERYSLDFGPITIAGTPPGVDGATCAYAPRRVVLDQLLLDAARDAGVEARTGFTVDELVVEDGTVVGIRGRGLDGRPVVERARVVVGADGWNSRVARAVGAAEYRAKPALQFSFYSYWRDLPVAGMEAVIRPLRGWSAVPTHDGLTMLVVAWPMAEAAAYKSDVEANYLATLGLAPDWRDRVAGATRVERFTGGAVPNLFRTPYGPGWALVGDAGYVRDPITGQGMSDAFLDAETIAAALSAALEEAAPFDGAMAAYQAARDARVLPIYEFTTQLATLEGPPPEVQQFLGAIAGHPEAMDAFTGVVAGTVSPADFFAPETISRLASPAAV